MITFYDKIRSKYKNKSFNDFYHFIETLYSKLQVKQLNDEEKHIHYVVVSLIDAIKQPQPIDTLSDEEQEVLEHNLHFIRSLKLADIPTELGGLI